MISLLEYEVFQIFFLYYLFIIYLLFIYIFFKFYFNTFHWVSPVKAPMDKSNMAENLVKQTAWICRLDQNP